MAMKSPCKCKKFGKEEFCLGEIDLNNLQEKRREKTRSESINYVKNPITYKEFFLRYLLPNKPCIFTYSGSGGLPLENWKSRTKWVTEEGKPNFEYLHKKFGKVSVPVAVCDKKEFDSHPKIEKTFAEYLEYWQRYISANYPKSMPCLYLKDWHFNREFPDYSAYITPKYFQSDWLNEFWHSQQNAKDDYCFVYMGPKGSWTPFHADVFHSYSWSANICGQKRWILFPPGEEENLRDKFGKFPFDITSEELKDLSVYPNSNKSIKQYEVIQNPGEIIFIPSGWHHQVWNTKDTISINHNWLNGCCIDLNWYFLKKNLADVQKEISDCAKMEGWDQQCQVILKSLMGINYEEFLNLCKTIVKNRLQQLEMVKDSKDNIQCECLVKDNSSTNDQFKEVLSHCHLYFDLLTLKKVLTLMKQDKDFLSKHQIENLIKQIQF